MHADSIIFFEIDFSLSSFHFTQLLLAMQIVLNGIFSIGIVCYAVSSVILLIGISEVSWKRERDAFQSIIQTEFLFHLTSEKTQLLHCSSLLGRNVPVPLARRRGDWHSNSEHGDLSQLPNFCSSLLSCLVHLLALQANRRTSAHVDELQIMANNQRLAASK